MIKTKFCNGCQQTLPRTEFYWKSRANNKVQTKCKTCFKLYVNKEKRAYLYGITPEEYQSLLDKHLVCEICGEEETRPFSGGVTRLSVDHDHKTGEIRGMLCANCNLMIGYAKDNPELLEKAIGYLTR